MITKNAKRIKSKRLLMGYVSEMTGQNVSFVRLIFGTKRRLSRKVGEVTMPDREKVIKCLTDIEQIMICRQEICQREELQYWIELQEGVTDAIALLKEQEAVVRCKDCKAWKQYDDMNLGECELYPEYNKMGDWFCNFGERKEGR